MAASSNFEQLLFETAKACERMAGIVETFDRRVEGVEHRVNLIVERLVGVEKDGQHGDAERHEIAKKSETGFLTVERCLAEAEYCKREAAAAKLEAQRAKDAARDAIEEAAAAVRSAGNAVAIAKNVQQTIGRRGEATGKRRFTLLRIAWDALWKVIIPALVAALIALIAKGGSS